MIKMKKIIAIVIISPFAIGGLMTTAASAGCMKDIMIEEDKTRMTDLTGMPTIDNILLHFAPYRHISLKQSVYDNDGTMETILEETGCLYDDYINSMGWWILVINTSF